MITGKNKLKDRKKREQAQKIEDILKAARIIFRKKGFLKTTMDEIAYEASLSKPTIYKFFPTKEDLYFSLLIPEIQDCLQKMEEISIQLQLNMFNSGEGLVRSIINVFYDRYKKDPDIFRIGQLYQQAGMVWHIDKKTEDSLRSAGRDLMTEMRSLFDKAVSGKLIRDIDRFMLVDIMLGSFFGIVQLLDSKFRERDNDVRTDAVVEMTIGLFLDSIVAR